MATSNFDFEVKVIRDLEHTHSESQNGQPNERLEKARLWGGAPPKNHNRVVKDGHYIGFLFLLINFISYIMLAHGRLTAFIHNLLMLIDHFYYKSLGSLEIECLSLNLLYVLLIQFQSYQVLLEFIHMKISFGCLLIETDKSYYHCHGHFSRHKFSYT